MTMTYDPIHFAKLVQKNLVGNYEPIMRICGKIFIIDLRTLQMLFMLWIKNTFSECLDPCTNMKAPNSGDSSGQARRHGGAFGGSYPKIFFVPPKILLCSEKFVVNLW